MSGGVGTVCLGKDYMAKDETGAFYFCACNKCDKRKLSNEKKKPKKDGPVKDTNHFFGVSDDKLR